MKYHWRKLAKLLPPYLERKVYESYFKKQHVLWEANGRNLPPSHLLKQQALLDLAQRYELSILVETGTFMGDMIYALYPYFKKLYSIELSEHYHQQATRRFALVKKVNLILGDSAEKLNIIVPQLEQPALFWLDGHYSGGDTALGAKECPVYEELAAIFSSTENHIIVIDDARLFVGKNDYPTLEALRSFVLQHWPEASISIENDSIRIIKFKNNYVQSRHY